MIVSASYRSDIPAFYAEWFRRRLEAGYARVANPYGGQAYGAPLVRGKTEGFVFWTRNIAPFRGALAEVKERGFPFTVQYSITGYPRALEASVVPAERSIELLHDIARDFGPRVAVWRYDPVFITSLTPPDWHRRTFARLAAALQGATDEVVLSFAQIYAKTRSNTARAAKNHAFTWKDPETTEKCRLLADLAAIASEHGLFATLCAQPELLGPDLVESGVSPARCIDAARLSDIAGFAIPARTKGNRPGCLCAESRDIGAYDTCPHGCVYCYAVRRPELAKQRYRAHDPRGEFLIAP